MNYSDFLKETRQGRIQPVYFFHGEERFLLEEALAMLKRLLIPEGAGDLNHHLFSGSSARAQEVIDACQTFPVFSERRLVIVREMEGLPGSEGLGPYLNDPSPRTCLVLVAGKVDQRKKVFSLLRSRSAEVLFAPLNDAQTLARIKEFCHSMKVKLSPQAMLHLKDRAGSDLFHIRNEVEKISLASHGSKTLAPEDIEILLSGQAGASAFEWLDAIRAGDRERALRLLGRLLDAGEYPLALLGLLVSNLRRMKRAADSSGRGPSGPPGNASADRKMARAFNLCLEADSRLKGSRLSPQLILEALVLGLCDGAAEGARAALR